MSARLPTFFISHGGGPWPWMDGMIAGPYAQLAQSLRRMETDAGAQPRAILLISAHWEAPAFTLQTSAAPGMVYDYFGFPAHTYQIRYPAPGDPGLARRAQLLIAAAGLPCALDGERGFDHGMYTPMAVAWPDANVPTVQLSLREGLDPAEHIALGRALWPLRDEGVLIIGSGLSYHNLRAFGASAREPSQAFDAWLQKAITSSPPERIAALKGWEQAPAARLAHPREEHLLPLMVAVGAAEDERAATVYHEHDFMGGVTAASFRFGESAT